MSMSIRELILRHVKYNWELKKPMFIAEKQTGSGLDGWYKLVDPEKNITIRAINSPGYPDGGELLYEFELLFNGARMIFAGSKDEKVEQTGSKNDRRREFHISWVMRKLNISEDINLSLDELKDIISDSLKIWGRGWSDDRAKSFKIRFTENEKGWYIPYQNVSYWEHLDLDSINYVEKPQNKLPTELEFDVSLFSFTKALSSKLKQKKPNNKLSPITQRRLQQFRANGRGFWSLWIFLFLFAIAMAAPLLANDKPLLIKFDGALYTPLLHAYPETTFGGDFETETAYRDPYVKDLINEKGWMIWPPVRFSYDTINYDLPSPAPSPPTAENWLGTDDQGRDVLARVIYGFRISVLFGLILTVISSAIGIIAGAFQGFYGGWLDLIMQRVIEIWSSLPSLYILIIFSAMFVPGFWTLLFILLLFSWVSLVDVVRAEFLRTRNFDYVRAANALGVGNTTIMFRHVLPNAMVATLTLMPFILTGSITALTSLDFLGLGLPPGSPSLGELLAQGKNNLQAPWLGFTAFIALALMLSLLTFIGEAVRDAFDPRKVNL